MIYKWKLPGLYPVDADTAGTELDRIYELHGALVPKDVVEESRPDTAPLHSIFEWDNDKAADLYREHQASKLIRSIVVEHEEKKDDAEQVLEVRAFAHAQQVYHPFHIVLNNRSMLSELRDAAYRDMEAFRRKYVTLAELTPVFQAMDESIKKRGE